MKKNTNKLTKVQKPFWKAENQKLGLFVKICKFRWSRIRIRIPNMDSDPDSLNRSGSKTT